MTKPNAEQVGEAVELIKDHHRQYGAAATEARLSTLVYSIYSVLTGDGKPAADHADAIENARQERKKAAAAAEAAATPEPPAGGDDDEYTEEELQAMTVAALRDLAAEGEVDLTGTTDKASIIARLMASE